MGDRGCLNPYDVSKTTSESRVFKADNIYRPYNATIYAMHGFRLIKARPISTTTSIKQFRTASYGNLAIVVNET